MESFQEKIILLVIDKALFAACLALLGFFLSRKLEEFKHEKALSSEIIKKSNEKKLECISSLSEYINGVKSLAFDIFEPLRALCEKQGIPNTPSRVTNTKTMRIMRNILQGHQIEGLENVYSAGAPNANKLNNISTATFDKLLQNQIWLDDLYPKCIELFEEIESLKKFVTEIIQDDSNYLNRLKSCNTLLSELIAKAHQQKNIK